MDLTIYSSENDMNFSHVQICVDIFSYSNFLFSSSAPRQAA